MQKKIIESIKKLGVLSATARDVGADLGIPQGEITEAGWRDCLLSAWEESREEMYPPQPVPRKRLPPEITRDLCILWGLWIAHEGGKMWCDVTSIEVAQCAEISDASVRGLFPEGVREMREQVLQEAIHREIHRVIVQGLITGDPAALAAPASVRDAAWKSVEGR
jgi:hypothetical protein